MLTETPKLERYIRHDIEGGDRPDCRQGGRERARCEAVDAGLAMGKGAVIVSLEAGDDILLARIFRVPNAGASAQEPVPQLFSFNSPQGMCPGCRGLGTRVAMDLKKVVPDPALSVIKGAIAPLGIPKNRWKNHFYAGVLKRYGATLQTLWKRISPEGQRALLYGIEGEMAFEWRRSNGSVKRHRDRFEGILPPMERNLPSGRSPLIRKRAGAVYARGRVPRMPRRAVEARSPLGRDRRQNPARCRGDDGRRRARFFFLAQIDRRCTARIAEDALKEIIGRLQFLLDVGLDYLALESHGAPRFPAARRSAFAWPVRSAPGWSG